MRHAIIEGSVREVALEPVSQLRGKPGNREVAFGEHSLQADAGVALCFGKPRIETVIPGLVPAIQARTWGQPEPSFAGLAR